MAGKIRLGFIGAGGIAVGHYHRTLETKKAVVTAITEPSDLMRKRFYEHCPGSDKLPAYSDYREMLKKESLDGVIILSPHTVHFPQIMDSLQRGLHVLTEKPMVCRIRDAKTVIKKAEDSGRILMISYQVRFIYLLAPALFLSRM